LTPDLDQFFEYLQDKSCAVLGASAPFVGAMIGTEVKKLVHQLGVGIVHYLFRGYWQDVVKGGRKLTFNPVESGFLGVDRCLLELGDEDGRVSDFSGLVGLIRTKHICIPCSIVP
jgi:hypothetical protein